MGQCAAGGLQERGLLLEFDTFGERFKTEVF